MPDGYQCRVDGCWNQGRTYWYTDIIKQHIVDEHPPLQFQDIKPPHYEVISFPTDNEAPDRSLSPPRVARSPARAARSRSRALQRGGRSPHRAARSPPRAAAAAGPVAGPVADAAAAIPRAAYPALPSDVHHPAALAQYTTSALLAELTLRERTHTFLIWRGDVAPRG